MEINIPTTKQMPTIIISKILGHGVLLQQKQKKQKNLTLTQVYK